MNAIGGMGCTQTEDFRNHDLIQPVFSTGAEATSMREEHSWKMSSVNIVISSLALVRLGTIVDVDA